MSNSVNTPRRTLQIRGQSCLVKLKSAIKISLPGLVLCGGAMLHLSAATFYTPVSVTSPNSVELYSITRLHQGPGVGYAATPPHAGYAGQTWVTDAPGGYPADYIAVAGAPILIIDLVGNHATEPGTVVRTVTVRNTGTSAALTLSSVTVDGADAARFSVVSFPASVAAGAEGTMTLNFHSSGAGGCWFEWLRIASNDPGNPVMTLGLLASVNCTPAAPEQPLFSQAAGTFGVNFPLTLISPTPGAAIIFTTDGTVPSLSNGQPYTGPVQITRTTMVRAACIHAGQVSGIESAGFIKLSPALLAKTSPLPIFPSDVGTGNLRRLDTGGPVAAGSMYLRVRVSLP